MQSLWERSAEYAQSRGYELLIIDGPAIDRYAVARDAAHVVIMLDAGTASGPSCGEVVWRACEQIALAQMLSLSVQRHVSRLIAS